jgi:hypothetical protein
LAGFDIGSVLLRRTTTSRGLQGVAIVSSNAHIALTVTGQGILTSETSTTAAGERLLASVGLQVALEIMTANKFLIANIALVWTVIEMGLHMGLDILLATEAAILAIMPQAHPLSVLGIGARDVLVNLIVGDTRLSNGCLDTSIEVEIIEGLAIHFGARSHERGLH